jgi:hypothetical protein
LTNLPEAAKMEKLSPTQSGPVAQLGARFHGIYATPRILLATLSVVGDNTPSKAL